MRKLYWGLVTVAILVVLWSLASVIEYYFWYSAEASHDHGFVFPVDAVSCQKVDGDNLITVYVNNINYFDLTRDYFTLFELDGKPIGNIPDFEIKPNEIGKVLFRYGCENIGFGGCSDGYHEITLGNGPGNSLNESTSFFCYK